MKIRTAVLFVVLVMLPAIAAASGTDIEKGDVFFAGTPALSPDGGQIVFSYEGDLWIVKSSGGTAYRLTGMEGRESFPRFSPDGRWIAFSGTQQGNNNIYVVPSQGGEIKQLTFIDSADYMDSWSWDSKTIYFNSDRYNSVATYTVSRDGGTPKRLLGHFFNRVHAVVVHPVTGTYYFTDTWESSGSSISRKRYKGAYNPDIKSYNPKTKEFKVHAQYEGKDLWPMVDGKGVIYFASDRDNGEYNLYRLEDGKAVKLTSFDSSIKFPQVSADGSKIVFEKDYRLYTYNVAEKRTQKVKINLFRNDTLATRQDFDVSGKVTYFDVSPDNRKFAFVSRGELFVSDVKGKFIRKLETAASGRVMEVLWLKDNKTLLFTQTADGWQNLFTIRADGQGKEKQLTSDQANNRNLSMDGDKNRVLYLSGRDHIKVMDLKTFQSKTVVTDELWGFYNSQPRFSPDSNYILFTAYRNFEEDILVYDIKNGKTFNLTESGVTESEPFWSPCGKYVYFASRRIVPSYPNGSMARNIYRLPLQKHSDPFKSGEWEKLFKEEKKEKKDTDKKPEIAFNLEEMYRRWQQVSPSAGNQSAPYVVKLKKDTVVLYRSNHDGKSYNLWKTTYKPFEPPETRKIEGCTGAFIVSAKDQYYALASGSIGTLDIGGGKFKQIKMKYTFKRNLAEEFNQMFHELWAGVEENFYDEKFHGEDWRKLKKKYGAFLPYIRSRNDLRVLIADMLGELNSSHLGFRSRGDEEKTFHSIRSMRTGILFEEDNPYTVKALVTDSPVDKKEIGIEPGDVLTEVNGKAVEPGMNREWYFTVPRQEEELVLTFKRRTESGSRMFTVRIHPGSSRGIVFALYDEWVRANQKRVDEKGGKRIAYVHMKNMGGRELRNFLVEMTREAYLRDALILDLRYNTGGNVHNEVLQFLSQRPYMLWKYRGGSYAHQPHFAPRAKPLVLLINEQSLSDAEFTASGFKTLKLGTVIGTETYRWIIFTSGKSLVDGSYYRLPSWGCYTLDKKDLEWTGVAPDIYVKNTLKDRLEGNDPQLDRAIEEILQQLK